MLKIGLVGTWHVHFEGYAREIARREDCKITALWDSSAEAGEKYAAQFGCDYVADYGAFLAREDVEAVMVCSATDMHRELMIRAAEAGKHIFTEKVLCFNEKDALAVKEAVERNGVKFCISFPWRGRGDFLFVKEAVENGLVGKVNYIRMRNAHNGTGAGWLPETFYDKQHCGGGAMMDLGAHSMYLLNWLLGRPQKAASAFTNVTVNSVEDNAVTVLTYENGAIGVSETAFVAPNNPFELEVVGDKGTILAGGMFDRLCYNVGEGWIYPRLPEGKPSPLNMWADGIINGTEIPYTIEDAVDLSYVMELAYNNVIS